MKVTRKGNWRVVIIPDLGYAHLYPGSEAYMSESTCTQITAQVARHIDDVASVAPEFDWVSTCSYCGAEWTGSGSEYNDGCCLEDRATETDEKGRDEQPAETTTNERLQGDKT